MVPDERMIRWIDKFNSLSPEAKREELLRVEKEFYLPSRAPRLAYCPDLSRVPAAFTDDVNSGIFDMDDLSEQAKALLQFIREHFGKRCARAAIAVMHGCYSGAEVGAHMGVARQTADEHLEKIRSKVVQRKAIELGLVTRESFIKAAVATPKRKTTRKTKTKAKPRRKTKSKARTTRKVKAKPPRKIKARRRQSPRRRIRRKAA